MDRSAERQFVRELLDATRAGRVVWSGTIRPGCYQYAVGEYIVAIASVPEGVAISLHHNSGHQIEALRASELSPADSGAETAAQFAELLELARVQALGLRARWRRLSKQLAGPPLAIPGAEA